jgi:hypothetical protein
VSPDEPTQAERPRRGGERTARWIRAALPLELAAFAALVVLVLFGPLWIAVAVFVVGVVAWVGRRVRRRRRGVPGGPNARE